VTAIRTILLFVTFAFAASAADIVPSTNQVDWTFAGVQGGIPYRTTIYARASASTSTVSTLQTIYNNAPSNSVILLEAGKYSLNFSGAPNGNGNWNIADGITIRGETNSSGWPTTYLEVSNLGGPVFNLPDSGSYPGGNFSAAEWNADIIQRGVTTSLPQGATTVTLDSAPTGLSVGDLFWLDAYPDGTYIHTIGGGYYTRKDTGGDRSMQQTCRVTAINGSILTFEPPIVHPMWDKCTSPEAFWLDGFNEARWTGIEDMAIKASSGGEYVFMGPAQNCWARNVCMTNISGSNPHYALKMAWTLNCEARDCLIQDQSQDLNQVYGIDIVFSGHDKVENCIIKDLAGALAWSGEGHVIAYNYVTNMLYDGASGTHLGEVVFSHGHHQSYTLIEGNHFPHIDFDYVYGNSSFMLVARNRITGWQEGRISNTYPLVINSFSHNMTAVGNILGYGGYHTSYQSGGHTAIFAIGSDTKEINRYGNWNTFDSGVHSGEELGASTVADSYVYDSKPDYFGNLDWPPYDIANATTITNVGSEVYIPAGYRLLNGQWPGQTISAYNSFDIGGKVTVGGTVDIR